MDLALGLKLMVYGLLTVFSVLILLILIIYLLVKIFPVKEDDKKGEA